LEKRQKTDDVV